MSEPNSWKQEYTKLSDFVTEHPEVEVEASRVRIPESVRPEFYRLFNTARTAFVEEKLADLLKEARSLGEEYTKVEAEVIKLLELEKISLAAHLHRFLHSPIDELVRGLLDPLFDLLKGKLDIQKFEEGAPRDIEASFKGLYRSGYEKWVALSLVILLESDKLFQVTPRKFHSHYDRLFTGVSSAKEDVPIPKESGCLSFDHRLTTTLIAPDFMVHSARVNRYVALRSVIGEALTVAKNASEAREWYHLDSIGAFTSGLTLIYIADKPEEISLVADAEKICRPDLILECEGNKDWYGEERMEKTKLQHNVLKPILGMYVVSHESMPEQAYKDLMPEESVAPTLGEEKPEQGDIQGRQTFTSSQLVSTSPSYNQSSTE